MKQLRDERGRYASSGGGLLGAFSRWRERRNAVALQRIRDKGPQAHMENPYGPTAPRTHHNPTIGWLR